MDSDLQDFKTKDFLTQKCVEKLIGSIPTAWKIISLRDLNFIPLANSVIEQKWTAKKVYASLIKPDFSNRLQSWHKEGLDISLEQFKSLSSKCTLITNINIRSFYVKFNYKCLTLNSVLSKYSAVSPLCTFCSQSQETYLHLFWECAEVAKLWDFVKSKLPTFYQEFIDKFTVFFPLGVPTVIFLTILFVKHFIYSSHCRSNKPRISHFRNFLAFHLRCMFYVSKFKGKQQQFLNNWECVANNFKINLSLPKGKSLMYFNPE